MAPVLQCPDCSTKHPLDVVSDAAAFRCKGCGRVLKVPDQFRTVPATAAAPTTPRPPVGAPATNGRVGTRRLERAVAGVVPFWIRLLLWFVAVPASFVLVFGIARVLGLLTTSQLEDVFLETGWDRFWPVARLLPFVAFITASIVHFSVLGISRWRIRRAAVHLAPRSQPQRDVREPARPAS
jgi:hypothetical protein